MNKIRKYVSFVLQIISILLISYSIYEYAILGLSTNLWWKSLLLYLFATVLGSTFEVVKE